MATELKEYEVDTRNGTFRFRLDATDAKRLKARPVSKKAAPANKAGSPENKSA